MQISGVRRFQIPFPVKCLSLDSFRIGPRWIFLLVQLVLHIGQGFRALLTALTTAGRRYTVFCSVFFFLDALGIRQQQFTGVYF